MVVRHQTTPYVAEQHRTTEYRFSLAGGPFSTKRYRRGRVPQRHRSSAAFGDFSEVTSLSLLLQDAREARPESGRLPLCLIGIPAASEDGPLYDVQA